MAAGDRALGRETKSRTKAGTSIIAPAKWQSLVVLFAILTRAGCLWRKIAVQAYARHKFPRSEAGIAEPSGYLPG